MSLRSSSTLSIAPALLMLAALTIATQVSGHPLAPALLSAGAALSGVVFGRLIARALGQRLALRAVARGARASLETGLEGQASASGATSL